MRAARIIVSLPLRNNQMWFSTNRSDSHIINQAEFFSFPFSSFSLSLCSFALLFLSLSFKAVLPFPLQVEMICAGLQTLVFVGARKLTEIVCNSARDMLKAKVPFPSLGLLVLACPPPPSPLASPFTRLRSRLPASAARYAPLGILPLRLSCCTLTRAPISFIFD